MNKNLFITVSRESGSKKYDSIVNYLMAPQIRKCKGVLIYCRTRKLLNDVYNSLRHSYLDVHMFHAGIGQKDKVDLMNSFRSGKIRIIATTNALGMGLDFENLECIIHLNMPKSI